MDRPKPSTEPSLERLLPVLVQIQAHAHEDPSLDELADISGLSSYYFHRQFRDLTGETPKQYCERLRLERAACRLLLYGGSILDVALDCGYRNHETFSRAFRRRFGVSPRDYRSSGRGAHAEQADGPPGTAAEQLHSGFELSQTRVCQLADIPVAFIRSVGPYESVDDALWDRLQTWTEERPEWAGQSRVLLGIAQDAPGITPEDKLRFDAALRAPARFAASGEIGFQVVSGGVFAVTTHIGPYVTLAEAYRTVVSRVGELPRYDLAGLPFIEVYRTTEINKDYALNQTDLYMPLRRI